MKVKISLLMEMLGISLPFRDHVLNVPVRSALSRSMSDVIGAENVESIMPRFSSGMFRDNSSVLIRENIICPSDELEPAANPLRSSGSMPLCIASSMPETITTLSSTGTA